MSPDPTRRTIVFLGAYTRADSDGIHIYELNDETGALTRRGAVAGVTNPSYLALSPNGEHLYCVCEIDASNGRPGGGVTAYAVNPQSLELTRLNEQPSHGRGPCHVSVDASGRMVMIANYGSGSVGSYPVLEDGSLGPAGTAIQHEGSSVNESRQEGPHAHSILPDPTNRFAFAADLGTDRLMCYRIDPDEGTLTPNQTPFGETPAGAGPRHFTFAPNGRHLYVINELDNTMLVYDYDSLTGTIKQTQVIGTLPAGWEGTSHCADVHTTPDGCYLYGSNRGQNSIVAYQIDQADGKLSLIGHTPTRGAVRGFAVDPHGHFLIAGNQDAECVSVFRIDGDTGELSDTGHEVTVSKPVCVKMHLYPR